MVHVENALRSAQEAFSGGRMDEAEREARSVLEFDGFEPRALRLLGRIAQQRGESRRAAELFQQALQARNPGSRPRQPEGPLPTPTLAELYTRQGHFEAAAAVYRELLAAANGDPREEKWRRRLAELAGEGSAGAESSGVAPEKAERNLRAFLERLDGSAEARRLQEFLSRLGDRGRR